MRRKMVWGLAVLGLLVAMGPSPRYLEELVIGGGYGSAPDGGMDLEADGDLLTDGAVTIGGPLTVGADDGADHAVGVLAGSEDRAGLWLNEADALHGGGVWFDGLNDTLRLGTLDGSDTPVPALRIARGSSGVRMEGGLATAGDLGVGVDYTPGARLHVRGADGGGFVPGLLLHNASDLADTSVGILFQTAAPDADRAKGAIVYASTASYGRGDLHFLNSADTDPGNAEVATDTRMTLTNDGRLLLTQYLGTLTDDDLISLTDGAVAVKGEVQAVGGAVDAGADGVMRGVLTAWDGFGGAAPGVLRLHAPGGAAWYLFVEDDGTLRVHNALPTSNTDGSIVGLQN